MPLGTGIYLAELKRQGGQYAAPAKESPPPGRASKHPCQNGQHNKPAGDAGRRHSRPMHTCFANSLVLTREEPIHPSTYPHSTLRLSRKCNGVRAHNATARNPRENIYFSGILRNPPDSHYDGLDQPVGAWDPAGRGMLLRELRRRTHSIDANEVNIGPIFKLVQLGKSLGLTEELRGPGRRGIAPTYSGEALAMYSRWHAYLD